MPDLYPKDSISNYSYQWDMINASNPAHDAQIQRRLREIEREKIDAIQSEKIKREKELLEKIKGISHFRILQMILTAGRLTFLGAILPPYLLFVGIPKWLISTGSPILSDYIQKLLSPIIDKVDNFKDFMKEFYENIMQFMQKKGKIIISAAEMFNKLIRKIAERIVGKPVKTLINVTKSVKNTVSNFLNLPKRVSQSLKSRLAQGKNYLFSIPRKMLNTIQKKTSQSLSKISNQTNKLVSPISNVFKAASSATRNIATSTKELLQDLYRSGTEAVKSMNNSLTQNGEALKRKFNPLIERLNAMTEQIQKTNEQFRNAAKSNYEKIRKRLELISEDARRGVKRKFDDFVTLSMKATAAIAGLLPFHLLPQMMKEVQLPKFIKNFIKKGKEKNRSLLHEKIAFIKGALKLGCMHVLSWSMHKLSYFQKAFLWLLKFINHLYFSILSSLRDVLIGIKVSYEFMFIFGSYGKLVVKNTANEIIAWLRQQQVTKLPK